jgi:hypothetical protein
VAVISGWAGKRSCFGALGHPIVMRLIAICITAVSCRIGRREMLRMAGDTGPGVTALTAYGAFMDIRVVIILIVELGSRIGVSSHGKTQIESDGK